ncbi:MAG TPA: hypothetical protein VMP01_16670 [Pirellulaceae bacterium]|nr:hypothetical protein [Pirellulaceae bacterium]
MHPPASPSTKLASGWPLLAVVASIFFALSGGCCGGRLVSVQLYESDPGPAAAHPCAQAHSLGLPGLFHRNHRSHLASGAAGFRGPALAGPQPRFHPVPTQPVFEPRLDATPLRLLDSRPTRPGDSTAGPEPTPAKTPQPDDPPA